jgi:hypothetical protein
MRLFQPSFFVNFLVEFRRWPFSANCLFTKATRQTSHNTGGRLFFWLLLLFAAVYLARTFDVGFIVGDEGVATLNAWRIASGQVPCCDFFEIIPPASFVPLALLFKFCGISVLSERILVGLLAVLLILSVDRLAQYYTNDYWCRSMAVAVLIPYGVTYWPIPSHHWFADVFSLWALVFLMKSARSLSPVWCGVWAGIFTALDCFTLQDQGAFLLLGLAVLFFPFVEDAKKRVAIFLSWCGGGLLVAAGFAVYLLPRTSLEDIAYQWFFFPLTRYKGIPGNASSLFSGWEVIFSFLNGRSFSHAFLDWILLLLLWGFIFILPFFSLTAIAWAFWKRALPRAELGLVSAGWIAFFAVCARRWTMTNLVWSAPMFLALASWGLARCRLSSARVMRIAANTVVAVVAGASIVYASFEMAQAGPSSLAEVHSRAGTVSSLVPEESRLLQSVVDGVEQQVPKGEPLFIGSFFPLVNFLTLTPPATRYNFFQFPVYNTEAQAREVRDTLEERKVRFALLPVQSLPGDWLRSYFAERFRPVWGNGVVVLMERVQGGGSEKKSNGTGKEASPAMGGPQAGSAGEEKQTAGSGAAPREAPPP